MKQYNYCNQESNIFQNNSKYPLRSNDDSNEKFISRLKNNSFDQKENKKNHS